MKKQLLVWGVMGVLALQACENGNRNKRDDAAVKTADSTSDTTSRAQAYTADVDLNGDEKSFILTTLNDGMTETAMANQVIQQSKNPEVKALAQQIAADHTANDKNLSLIAKGKGINPDQALSAAQLKDVEALKTLSGPSLDKQYLTLVISGHNKSESLFGKAVTFKNKDLRTFAINALPKMQSHHKEALRLGKKMNLSNVNNGDDIVPAPADPKH